MLLPVVAAFLLGLLIGSSLPYLPLLSLFLLVIAAALLMGLERSGRLSNRHGGMLYAGLLIGVLYWTLFAWLHAGVPLARMAGEGAVRVGGTVASPAHYTPDRSVFLLSVSEMGTPPKAGPASGRVRVTWRDPGAPLKQGDHISFVAHLREPAGQLNPGGFDYAGYLARQGVDAVATVSGPQAILRGDPDTGVTGWNLWRRVDGWRDRIREAARRSLQGPALGIFLGMIVGQPGYLSPEVRDAFMATGTVHILSISGSHLGLVAFLSFLVIKGLCLRLPARWLLALSRHLVPSRLAAAGTVLPVTLYALLAGSEIATVRSLVMILLFLLAVWLGRQEQLLLTLACAALLILLHDPRALFDISFQLSYGSVLAIALVIMLQRETPDHGGGPPVKFSDRVRASICTYAWLTGGVTLTTLPLVAYHFNQVAWLGLVANLVVIPLAGLVLVPLGLLCAVLVLLTGSAGLPGAALNQFGFDLLFDLVQALARIPGAEWHVASPAIASIVGFYLLLGAAIAFREDAFSRRLCFLLALGCAAWWTWSPRPLATRDTLRVTFLDVGQGDAAVVELPDGQTALIDGGARHDTLDMGRAIVAPYLWDRGIFRLDHVIGTHPQLDHVGGLISVLSRFPVAHYWGNGLSRPELFHEQLRAVLHSRGLVESVAAEGESILSTRQCRLLVLNPTQDKESAATETAAVLNNRSVVTRLDCGLHSFLFSADIENQTLTRLAQQPASAGARILKVPHHGAGSSLDEPWIRHVRPEVAVISVGSRNPYGHPAPAVLRAYEETGIRLLRTDHDGAIWITASVTSPHFALRTAREGLLQPVRIGPFLFHDEARNLARMWLTWWE